MIAMIFQNVEGGFIDTAVDVDVFIDMNGNQHKVWRQEVNGTYQVFYSNTIGSNNTGVGLNDYQVTYSEYDVVYPRLPLTQLTVI